MIQSQLISLVAERPAQFAWFLGAGASRTAGLPTAGDIIWDLKRRYYKQEENRDVSPQDVQNDAVRAIIQSFMDSRGFPALWSDAEYSTYFEKIFGDDRERQRKYLKGMLAEDKVTLSVGNRVLGGLLAAGMCRAIFTTNFDSVVEKAFADVGGGSLQAYSLEGTASAANAILNEEYPFYCKLHGDFRFESLKNLNTDLAAQNEDLSKAFVAAGTRFGVVVAGYSGRDASVMKLMSDVLEAPNPFPHGLYWTGLKGSPLHPSVQALIGKAVGAGVKAEYVEIETFDAFMSRLWRNIDNKPPGLDAKVRKTRLSTVSIPLPSIGNAKPLLRLNALPVQVHGRCLELTFKRTPEWAELREATREQRDAVIVTKGESIWAWGLEQDVRNCFGDKLTGIAEASLPVDFSAPENLHFKAFIEEAILLALTKDKPLLPRVKPSAGYIIVNPHAQDIGPLSELQALVSRTSGTIPGILSPVSDRHPKAEKVQWAESLRVSLDRKQGRDWILLEPDIWIWPTHARSSAVDFLDKRKGGRFNKMHNQLLQAWTGIILGTDQRNTDLEFRPFASGSLAENPTFQIGTRTAFSRRFTA
jgi:SIR2-like domain